MRIDVTQEDIESGEPGEPGFCPIALAFKRVCPLDDIRDIEVMEMECQVRVHTRPDGWWVYSLPDQAQDFVSLFDDEWKVEPFAFEMSDQPEWIPQNRR